MTRRDTLAERVARAQREIDSWTPRVAASMQLQGGSNNKRNEGSCDYGIAESRQQSNYNANKPKA